VRGTRALERRFAKERRFIPACAGNTHFSPRLTSPFNGSSPRVRGTLPGPGAGQRRMRFIPACAGNTGASE